MTDDPPRTVACVISSDDTRRFSSFPDFLNDLIARGIVSSREDLLANRPDLVHDIIFKWYRQGQIACQYAVHLALTPEASKWLSEIVPPGFEPRELDERIDTLADSCEGLQLVFPGVTTASEAAELVVKLCKGGHWACYEGRWDYSERDERIPLALRWNSPDGRYTSWVLGIAPFESMPFTRRFVGAPFTTLVFRPAPPTRKRPTRDPVLNRSAAHLAHMDDRCGNDQKLRRELQRTTESERKKLLVRDFKSLARAQTTFALPASCRSLIAPVLTSTAQPKGEKPDG